MTRPAPDLDALLGSRICHDLISPLGAISNGMELLAMSGAAQGPEFALIAESVENANARIRFFRVAFGVATPGQTVNSGEVRSILAALSAGGRTTLVWAPREGVDRGVLKLAFLLVQCLETAMPWGGTVDITADGDRFTMTGTAGRTKPIGPLWAQLNVVAEEPPVEASEVHFPLAARCAAEIGRTIAVDVGETAISITF